MPAQPAAAGIMDEDLRAADHVRLAVAVGVLRGVGRISRRSLLSDSQYVENVWQESFCH